MYTSPEAEYADRSVEYQGMAGFMYFREWRRARITDRGTEKENYQANHGTFGMNAGFQYAAAERKGNKDELSGGDETDIFTCGIRGSGTGRLGSVVERQ